MAAPRYIPDWNLTQEDLDILIAAEVEAAPDIIYAQEVPADPTTDLNSIDLKDCYLILLEIGFCRDLGCHDKLTKKSEKFQSLRRYKERVELNCIPIGHAGTTLHDTATDIATALAKDRPSISPPNEK